MTNFVFKLPDLGEGTVESEIAEWRVNEGEHITMDEPLVDMMTDKATVEITAPVSGKVVSLAGKPGDIIPVGAELIVFETDENFVGKDTLGPAPEISETLKTEEVKSVQQPSVTKASDIIISQKPLTSPSIRRRAREAGVDLTLVPGTGVKNRISHEDLDKFIRSSETNSAFSTGIKLTQINEVPIIGLRRKIAERMTQSKRSIPHFGYVEEVDITELETLRQHLNENREKDQLKLSYLPFFLQALVKVLKIFPQCNALYDEERGTLRQYAGIHAGIATQTDSGLKVPVIKHVESLDIWQCAAEIQRLAQAARNNTAKKDELSGSTITITSLGALGGIAVTPIINYPEVSIIGINKSEERAVVRNGQIVIRRMMNLSSCFDHRFVDGYDAAQMIQSMKKLLEHPATIFI